MLRRSYKSDDDRQQAAYDRAIALFQESLSDDTQKALRSFDRAVCSFMRDRKRNFTHCTKVHYLTSLKKFRCFLKQRKLTIDELTKDDFRDFMDWCEKLDPEAHPKKPVGAKTLHGMMIDLKGFFKWVTTDNEWPKNPIGGVSLPDRPKLKLDHYKADEYEAIKSACEGKGLFDLRDKAIVSLFLDSGVRLSDMKKLIVGKVDLDRGIVTVEKAKGDKDYKAVIFDNSIKALRKYLKARGMPKAHEPLWVGKRGALSSSGISQIIKRRGAKAKLKPSDVACHKFRRTMPINMYAQGASQALVQEQMGHDSPYSQIPYLKFSEGELRQALNNFDPSVFPRR